MVFEYYLVYTVVNIVCLAFALTVLARLTSSVGSEMENRLFRMMLLMYMAFLACEVIWAVSEGGFVPFSPFFAGTVKMAGTAFIPIMVYFWFQYAEIGYENPEALTKKFRFLTAIPVIFMVIVYLSSPATGLIAKVTQDGTVIEGPMIALTGVIDNLYGIAVIVHALILFFRNKNAHRRRVYITHIMFIVICTIGGLADAVISNTPIMPLAVLLSYNVLFINLQESKIFNDAVTGLNNRRMADNYLTDAISDASEKEPFCLMMMNIDGIDSVSDRQGRLEGEKALKAASESMKRTVSKWNGFLARWSEDQFMVGIKTGDADKVDALSKDIQEGLDAVVNEKSLPCVLGLNVGREFCRNKETDPEDLIKRADRKLYEAKAANDIGTGEWIRL